MDCPASRTRNDCFDKGTAKAKWDFLRQLKEDLPGRVIYGNGEVSSAEDAVEMLKTGCDGIMVATKALGDPAVLQGINQVLRGKPVSTLSAYAKAIIAAQDFCNFAVYYGFNHRDRIRRLKGVLNYYFKEFGSTGNPNGNKTEDHFEEVKVLLNRFLGVAHKKESDPARQMLLIDLIKRINSSGELPQIAQEIEQRYRELGKFVIKQANQWPSSDKQDPTRPLPGQAITVQVPQNGFINTEHLIALAIGGIEAVATLVIWHIKSSVLILGIVAFYIVKANIFVLLYEKYLAKRLSNLMHKFFHSGRLEKKPNGRINEHKGLYPITSRVLYDYASKIEASNPTAAAQLRQYADWIKAREAELLAANPQGPPAAYLVAYYDAIADLTVFNIPQEQIPADILAFIQEHEDLHQERIKRGRANPDKDQEEQEILATQVSRVEASLNDKAWLFNLGDDQKFELMLTPEVLERYQDQINWFTDRLKKSTAGVRGTTMTIGDTAWKNEFAALDSQERVRRLKEDYENVRRGEAESLQLHPFIVALFAQAYANYIKKNFPQEMWGMFVGHDERFFSPEYAGIVSRVLAGSGIRVIRDSRGGTATPVSSYMGYLFKLAGSIEITSSHNPPYQNGLKSSTFYGGVDTDDVSDKIFTEVILLLKKEGEGKIIFGTISDNPLISYEDAKELYFTNYMSKVFVPQTVEVFKEAMEKGAKFIFDGICGVGGGTIKYYLNRLLGEFPWGKNIIIINEQPDPTMKGILKPDPSIVDTLEYTGALHELATNTDVLISVTADMDADRTGTGVIIPDSYVELAKRYGLVVKNKNGINIVCFTPNQIFTLIAYERILQLFEKEWGTRDVETN